jgi:hypothetical protein
MIEIEKGIPIPPQRPWGHETIYPWRTMEIGDSFFISGKPMKQAGSLAAKAAARTGQKFTLRTVDGGVRVWRIA